MSRDASLTTDFGDGTYKFRLGWGELSQLQEAVDAGPYVVLDRLRDRADGPLCGPGEISNVIRLGLIGGGMEDVPALKLVRQYVEANVPERHRQLAWAIMAVSVYGAPEEPVGKKKGRGTPTAS